MSKFYAKTIVIDNRCDVPMRRSKEQCNTPNNTPWRCTEDCKSCICCIVKDENGDERHLGANKWKPKNIWKAID